VIDDDRSFSVAACIGARGVTCALTVAAVLTRLTARLDVIDEYKHTQLVDDHNKHCDLVAGGYPAEC
jgi:hypothetical protein